MLIINSCSCLASQMVNVTIFVFNSLFLKHLLFAQHVESPVVSWLSRPKLPLKIKFLMFWLASISYTDRNTLPHWGLNQSRIPCYEVKAIGLKLHYYWAVTYK